MSFGINLLLRYPFAVVPQEYAPDVQRAARDELGLRTTIGRDRKRTQRRIVRLK